MPCMPALLTFSRPAGGERLMCGGGGPELCLPGEATVGTKLHVGNIDDGLIGVVVFSKIGI